MSLFNSNAGTLEIISRNILKELGCSREYCLVTRHDNILQGYKMILTFEDRKVEYLLGFRELDTGYDTRYLLYSIIEDLVNKIRKPLPGIEFPQAAEPSSPIPQQDWTRQIDLFVA